MAKAKTKRTSPKRPADTDDEPNTTANKFEPKTREGKIARAFVDSLPELTPLMGKQYPTALLRRKTWQIIRRRIPGVTQAAVTRTLFKFGEIVEMHQAIRRKGKQSRA